MADYKAAAQKAGREIIRGEIGYRRLQQCFGGVAADSIASSQIEAFRDRLSEDLSPATVNLHLKLLRAIFMRAVRAQTVSSNPVSRVRFCKENNKRLRWLSEEEENALFTALPDWLKPLIVVALNTGMRKGELLKLRWRDVDFATGTMTIRDPKSGEDEHVLMNETTKGSLRTLWEARLKIVALKDRIRATPSGFVFTAPRGGYIHDLKRYWYRSSNARVLRTFIFTTCVTRSRHAPR